VCRFRLALVAADLPERLFAELDRQLDAKGLFVKTGTSTAVLPSRQDLAVVTLRKPIEFGTKRLLWQIEER
jgi:IS5 family transposase